MFDKIRRRGKHGNWERMKQGACTVRVYDDTSGKRLLLAELRGFLVWARPITVGPSLIRNLCYAESRSWGYNRWSGVE